MSYETLIIAFQKAFDFVANIDDLADGLEQHMLNFSITDVELPGLTHLAQNLFV